MVRIFIVKRTQYVVTNNTPSDMLELCQYGVPRGSVFGPILFLLLKNDIHKSLNNIVIKLFANDTNCFLSGSDFSSLERLAKTELKEYCHASHWQTQNKGFLSDENQHPIFI